MRCAAPLREAVIGARARLPVRQFRAGATCCMQCALPADHTCCMLCAPRPASAGQWQVSGREVLWIVPQNALRRIFVFTAVCPCRGQFLNSRVVVDIPRKRSLSSSAEQLCTAVEGPGPARDVRWCQRWCSALCRWPSRVEVLWVAGGWWMFGQGVGFVLVSRALTA